MISTYRIQQEAARSALNSHDAKVILASLPPFLPDARYTHAEGVHDPQNSEQFESLALESKLFAIPIIYSEVIYQQRVEVPAYTRVASICDRF